MGMIQDATHIHIGGGRGGAGWGGLGGFPLLLEPCDIIAFDLQINRESVHLLGGDGRCDGRPH